MLSKEKPYTGTSTKAELKELMGTWTSKFMTALPPRRPTVRLIFLKCRGHAGDLIQTLLHHELFHQGQFYIFSNTLKFDLPIDWRDFWWIPKVYS